MSTPITDATYKAVRSFINEEQAVDALVEMRETSRKLERENAELNETTRKHVAAYYELLAQNTALRADKERLDWLDENGCWLTIPGARNFLSGASRAVIDAARKESQP